MNTPIQTPDARQDIPRCSFLTFNQKDMRTLIQLSLPLIMGSILESAIPFTSSLFLGRLGPYVLGVGALVISCFSTIMVLLWGMLGSVSVLVARYHGANEPAKMASVLKAAIWATVILSIPFGLIIWKLTTILGWLGQSPALLKLAVPYAHALRWAVLPDLLNMVLMQFLIGLGRSRLALVLSLSWFPLNIALNAVLVFGYLGLPALGMAGLGYGTAISFSLSLIVLLSMMWIRKEFRPYWLSGTWRKLPWCYLKEIFLVGCPLGVMFFVEVGFFFCLALIMGHYGVLYLAANQLAVQILSVFASVMFPIAQGISVRVGFLLGAQEPLHAHRALISGVLFAWIMGIGFAVFGWFGSSLVLQLDFSKAPPVMLVYYFKHFLLWMGVFQLFESQRIALFGGLRAHKDTRYTMIVSVISFWCIALPCGYLFSFGMGAEGYWLSFAVSAFIGVSLLWRRYYRMVKPGFMGNVLPQ